MPGRLSAALLLAAAALAGCADRLSPAATSLTWRHFLAAEDLRLVCDDDAPDRYRLIYHDRDPPRLRLFEVIEDREEGGADARGRVLAPDDMAQAAVDDAYSDTRGIFASYRLSPLQYATLVRGLEQSGAFDPPVFGDGRGPAATRLLAGGCRDGAWFFSVFEDPQAAGERIGLRR